MLITLALASLLAALAWEIGVVGYTQHSLHDPQRVPSPSRPCGVGPDHGLEMQPNATN